MPIDPKALPKENPNPHNPKGELPVPGGTPLTPPPGSPKPMPEMPPQGQAPNPGMMKPPAPPMPQNPPQAGSQPPDPPAQGNPQPAPGPGQSIKGVEIFAVGKWNGDTYTQKDLDEMVKAFNETSETIRPPLKIGHDDNQKLLQKDGLPAAGWIGSLYSKGGKLIADFVDIPKQVYELLTRGAYRKVSAEILWNADMNGSKYSKMLAAVALLGADMPAVSSLKDVLSWYSNLGEIKHYSFNTDGLTINSYPEGVTRMSKTEAEIKLEFDLKAEKEKAERLETEKKTYQKSLEDKESELSELKKFKAEAEAKAIEAEKLLNETKIEKELTELVSEKLISPAMKPYVKALLAEEKKEYSLQLNEKEQKFSKSELLKEILKLHAAASGVNFSESSQDNVVPSEKDEKALNAKITQYAKDHNVDYGTAYKAVLKSTG